MAIALATQHFCPPHKEKSVLFGRDTFGVEGLVIARPSSAGIKFSGGGKQRRVATSAVIVPIVMAVPIFSGEGSFGFFFSTDLKLLFVQSFPPLAFSFCDLF